jgi:hypothetical protein
MADDGDATPFDRLFAEEVDERPDEIVVDELTTMDAEEFTDCLEAIADASEAITTLAEDLERLRQTGLDESDARDLIYGRNHDLGKRDVETLFEAIDAIANGKADRPLIRLLSDVSGKNMTETEALLDELERLHRKYGGNDGDV